MESHLNKSICPSIHPNESKTRFKLKIFFNIVNFNLIFALGNTKSILNCTQQFVLKNLTFSEIAKKSPSIWATIGIDHQVLSKNWSDRLHPT